MIVAERLELWFELHTEIKSILWICSCKTEPDGEFSVLVRHLAKKETNALSNLFKLCIDLKGNFCVMNYTTLARLLLAYKMVIVYEAK
jgi:hypothetical protein